MMEESGNTLLNHNPVLHVLVIGFHHQKGYQVDFAYPPLVLENKGLPDVWAALPFMALPDGAHNFEEDVSIFHLPSLKDENTKGTETVFGVSCYRQIESKDLKVKEEGMTRRTVQKSVCVLMQMPLYGFVLSKLSLVTQAYFNERDFTKTDILELCPNLTPLYSEGNVAHIMHKDIAKDLYKSLNHSIETATFHDTIFNIGLYPGMLIKKLKHKALMILKLLLLERKVMIWGCPVKDVSIAAITLVSLLPGVLQKGLARSLQTSIETLNKVSQSPRDQYGLPINVFGNGCVFHPYLSLQQMNLLTEPGVHGYLIGATNVLFKDQSHTGWEAFVDLDSGSLQVDGKEIDKQVSLTTEDLRFCDYVVKAVTEVEQGENSTGWEGSDEWIRAQFKIYLLCMLASTENRIGDEEDESFAFNSEFLTAWSSTKNYQMWLQTEHPGMDAIVRQHPFAGETTVNDVKLRLQSMLESIASNSGSGKKIEEAVIKTGQLVGGALSSARSTLSSWRGWISGMVQDIDNEVLENAQRMREARTSDQKDGDVSVTDEDLNRGMSISESDRLGLHITVVDDDFVFDDEVDTS